MKLSDFFELDEMIRGSTKEYRALLSHLYEMSPEFFAICVGELGFKKSERERVQEDEH